MQKLNTINCEEIMTQPLKPIELTPDVLRTFTSKIVIHERKKKHDKNALQQIDIYFRYIGSMAEPQAVEETVAESKTKITAIA